MLNRQFALLFCSLAVLSTVPAQAQCHAFWGDMQIQTDKDEHGNRSHAWSSPIWVKKK